MPTRWPIAGIAAATVLLTATSCGEIPEPQGFTVATSTAEVATLADADTDGAVADAAAGTESPTTTDFVPRPPVGYVPQVVITGGGEVLVAQPDTGELTVLNGALGEMAVVRAIDDLLGGLVVQGAEPSGPVVWIAQGGESQVVDTEARLLDVGYVDGSPTAVVLVDQSTVERIRLVDEERTPLVTLAEGEEVVDLAASGGLHAVTLANDRCGDLRFYGPAGERVELAGPGEPDCIVPRRPAYGAVALSPDGAMVAYTVVSYRDDGIEVATEVVTRDLATGAEGFRRKIGEDGDGIVALGFDGQRLAYVRHSGQTSTVTVLDTGGAGQELPIDVAGLSPVDSVSFARNPVASIPS
ncbi:MAG: hypothetical protein ACFCVK_21560 [Acidimicrobiales bacterium]